MSEAAKLINLARLNLSSRDYETSLSCCEKALEAGPDSDMFARLRKVAQDLAQRVPDPLKERVEAFNDELSLVAPPPTGDEPDGDAGEDTQMGLEAARALITPDLVRMLRHMARGDDQSAPHPEGLLPLADVLGRLLASDLDLEGTLSLALELTLASAGAKRGFILARDSRGKLTVERGHGLGSDSLKPDFSTSVLAEVERTAKPVILQDAMYDPKFGDQSSVMERAVRSIACVPIPPAPGEHQILGAIYLEDPTTAGRFGMEIAEVLTNVATLVGGPIRKAQRFAAERRALAQAKTELRHARGELEGRVQFVGRSSALRDALDLLSKVATEEVPVRIVGESGTGKELAARFLHSVSDRALKPLVAENCAALAENLLETELFGVVRGAYTGADRDRPGLFQKADGGMLFLDEVGELSPACQAKLLRVLEEGAVRPVGGNDPIPVDVRVIVATHRDLNEMVREGTFREDLYYRLDVVRVRLPPLRERREDIPLLVDHFMEEIREERGDMALRLTPTTMARLAVYNWPGNVRELRNVVWRLSIAGDDGAPWLGSDATPGPKSPGINLHLNLDQVESILSLKEARLFFEREYVAAVLALHDRNVTRAAGALGMQRPHLSRLIKKLGIKR